MPAYKKYPYCIDCNLNAAQIDLIVEGKVDKNGREDVNKKLIAMNSAPSKGCLISESFSLDLFQIFKNRCQITPLIIFSFGGYWIVLRVLIWHLFFGDLSQTEKLSEIKPHLKDLIKTTPTPQDVVKTKIKCLAPECIHRNASFGALNMPR